MAYGIHLGYRSQLTLEDTVQAIILVRDKLIEMLREKLNLIEFTSPLVYRANAGFNDDFRETERTIDFDVPPYNTIGEISQSINKWRRWTLQSLDQKKYQGILTQSNFVRRDILQTNIQSIVLNEIGFDRLIDPKKDFLDQVRDTSFIVLKIISEVEDVLVQRFPQLKTKIKNNTFEWIEHVKLEKQMRLLSWEERINKYTRENGPIILYGLEKNIQKNSIEQFKSADVISWKHYAQIYVYDNIIEEAICIAYCGITPNKEILRDQLAITKETDKLKTNFGSLLATNRLDQTLTFGIWKDKLDLVLLEKSHIAEVISSVWDDKFLEYCKVQKIDIL